MVDVAKCHACHLVPHLPRKVKVDVTKCHACHVKRRRMSPSASPVTKVDVRKDKLCVSKLCVDKFCVRKLCVNKLCVDKLCDDTRVCVYEYE